ncbi:alanine racemase [Lentisphaera araneosa HTCC2155]|uniref:Alanine racemase n=1 Tax=Lentisphaera araneosa HTCC2155 TaxID=313628 RepID=A6DIS2_9BACT|nr:alanine racemase [Lentisphaera araneosa]EDM28358.1 alanine racemase [Lentisphaera araneosa HTCC2155]
MAHQHRNTLSIDLRALKENFHKLEKLSSPSQVMPVLKANAYGLGAKEIAAELKESGATIIAVADLNEALDLRDLDLDILILGDIIPEEIPLAIRNNFILPIGSLESAQLISAHAGERRVFCHLVIDSGMGRLGIPAAQALEEFAEIAKLEKLHFDGVYTHFPVAYSDREFSLQQIEAFKDFLNQCPHTFKRIHIANSDGIHNIPEACQAPFNFVRTGLNLYGCFDLEGAQRVQLEPILTLASRLVRVRELNAGMSIGYGREWLLEKTTLVGTVALGYADGFPFNTKAYVLYQGHKCPVIGRISMDYITIDLSQCPNAKSGDAVLCLGDAIPVAKWAKWKGTITYEIICSLGQRIKRIYKK